MTSRSPSGQYNTFHTSMPRSEMHTSRVSGGSASQSSSGASSPRRGRARMPVVIMSSQMPRLFDNRKHPYSQLSQSPVSPSLLPKDARANTSYTRFANRSRLAPTDRPLRSPVIQPQEDQYPRDEMPSPLLLPPQRSSKVETLQPLGQRQANRQHSRNNQHQMTIDLSGLNNKLGFHVPARETITPRGSDDESEDLLSFPEKRERRSGERGGKRNSRSLCIEEKAQAKIRLEDAPTRHSLRNAVSAMPTSRNTGILSPSERRGRSREVKPCSRSPKSMSRTVVPSVTVEEYGNGADDMLGEDDVGETETRTVEEVLSSHPPNGADRVGSPSAASVTSSMATRSTTQLMRTSSAERSLSPRAVISTGHPVGPTADSVHKERPGPFRKSGANKDLHIRAATTISSSILPPKPVRALSEKTCPTVMKNMVFAPASPVGTTIELADLDSSMVFSSSSLQMPRRSASISLKRIQDQDLETIMGSTMIKMPSPIASRFPTFNQDSDSLPYEEADPGREDSPVADRHSSSHGPFHWLREAVPKSGEAVPKARTLIKLVGSKSSRAVRAVSHHSVTGTSDSNLPAEGFESFGRTALKRNRTASTATEGGDQKRHYTRWDGVESRITEEDHPFHWAVLQRKHELRRQSSKQSLRHGLSAPTHSPKSINKNTNYQNISSSNDRATSTTSRQRDTPSRVVSLTSLAHEAVSSLARPVSHRHKSAPLRVPSYKDTGNVPENILGDNLRSSVSYEVLPYADGLVSLAASFDSKLAYKACKKEEGYVDFDKVLGLDNHDAVQEEAVGAMAN